MARHNQNVTESAGMGATPSLIRWGAVFGGAVIGLSLLVLLSAVWVAVGIGNGTAAVADNMTWFLAGSAVLSMFVGGLLAGWLSGVPGAAPGFFNGLTVWGLILIAALVVGPAAVMQTMGAEVTAGAEQAVQAGMQPDTLWAAVLALLVGALAAGLGGTVGGALTRPAFVYSAPAAIDRRESWTDERPATAGRPRDKRHADVEGTTVDVGDDRTELEPRETEPVGARDRDRDDDRRT
jgi:hypothetical protein